MQGLGKKKHVMNACDETQVFPPLLTHFSKLKDHNVSGHLLKKTSTLPRNPIEYNNVLAKKTAAESQ